MGGSGLDNRGAAGAYGGVTGADIRAATAWTISAGSASVWLALADTGVDPAHPGQCELQGRG
jgi:hypothetical protein